MFERGFPSLPPERFDELIGGERAGAFRTTLNDFRDRLSGRTFWCINSTPEGGGVAEILGSVLCYLAGGEVPTKWLVIEGSEEFFEMTKGLHHLLHGVAVDGFDLGEAERVAYEESLMGQTDLILDAVTPGDVVILHDPQTLGLAPALAEHGAIVAWSCHVGADLADTSTRRAWDFLGSYIGSTEAQVFSRPQYVWEGLDASSVVVIPPCVDAFSPKNQPMQTGQVASILSASGVVRAEAQALAEFVRQDESVGQVTFGVEMREVEPLAGDVRLVTQISRWDPLKDHLGLMHAFVDHVPEAIDADLVLAGPSPDSVADDPEAVETFEAVVSEWESLPRRQRSRVHLACLPMEDVEANAAIVNALQRRSDVIVQKSLAEGFGLTVAEAMLKARPTVGSRVGGIQDQIGHEESGLLVDDPKDLAGFGREISRLLQDPVLARRLGEAAAVRVVDEYLAPGYLSRWMRLADRLLD